MLNVVLVLEFSTLAGMAGHNFHAPACNLTPTLLVYLHFHKVTQDI